MTGRKAQFGLDNLACYAVFAVFLIFTMFALMSSSCGGNRKSVERGLDIESGAIANLRVSEQLTAYLRTPVPDKAALYEGMDEADKKVSVNVRELDYYESKYSDLQTMVSFDKKSAKEFLDEHPEVYVGRTYAEFLSALYIYGGDKRIYNVFDGVTKAMFYRHLFSKAERNANAGRLDGLYTSPIIAVSYGMQKNVHVGTLYSYNVALKTLPTLDGKGISVKLLVSDETAMEPAP